MARLIDAELTSKNIGRHRVLGLEKGDGEMNEAMGGYNPSSFIAGFDYGMELALKVVRNQPTVDAVEVVHGEWEQCFEDWRKQIEGDKCSACGFEHYGAPINHYHYCPNCGAKMDGGTKNETDRC